MNLFLFPHQDDESPVFFEIERLSKRGEALCIVYLTTGQFSKVSHEVRNRESLHVLANLGVAPESVHFLGGEIGVPDSDLPSYLEQHFEALTQKFSEGEVTGIHMPAWEGGHQDHDAAHLLGVALAQHWGLVDHSMQFPYYHGYRLKSILFKVLDGLPQNGAAILDRVPVATRWRYLKLLLVYKSQIGSWIGLGPFFALHYLVYGTQVRQPVSVARVREKPHPGAMLYERRNFCSYEKFVADTAPFVGLYFPGSAASPTSQQKPTSATTLDMGDAILGDGQ